MDEYLQAFLGELERGEANLLTWGLVDGFAAESELVDRAEAFLNRRDAWHFFTDGLALLNEMVARGLLFRWRVSNDYRYRTRLAETLRLLTRLRQLFPKHLSQSGAWLTGATL